MYCTHCIPSVLICICTINEDYYNLNNSDWINDYGSLLAKVEIKSHSRINNLDV